MLGTESSPSPTSLSNDEAIMPFISSVNIACGFHAGDPLTIEQTIRVISGPEAHCFEIAGLRSFLSTEYTVTAQSDRTGYRLFGEPIKHKEGMNNIISAGISLGTVQVPGDGQPIILLADRQTSGGYARLAYVITADLPLLAQMQPCDKVRFRETTLDIAQQVCISKQHTLFEYR